MSQVRVSIVVPTKNSEVEIRRCLDSIKLQSCEEIEIIVIDAESRDKTRVIAKEYGAKVVNIKSGRSQARNIGAKISRGRFILFVDSDQELDRGLVSRAVEVATLMNFDALRFPKIARGESFFGRVRNAESWLSYRERKTGGVPRFFERSTFLKLGGYDENLSFGEDRELWKCLARNKCKIGIVNAPIFEIENSFRKRISKNYEYGRLYGEYRGKGSQALAVLFESVNAKYIRNISSASELHYFSFAMTFKIFSVVAFILGRIVHSSTKFLGISRKQHASRT